jgi:hypothetical protein
MALYGLVEALGRKHEGEYQWQGRVTEMARAEGWVTRSEVAHIFDPKQNKGIYL